MKPQTINGKDYKLPGSLTKFQQDLYVHLINHKWNTLGITETGSYTYKGQEIEYDAILPTSVHKELPLIYSPIKDALVKHQKQFPFKLHKHFNHMASSQAANANLFLPILLSARANEVLCQIKDDFKSLETTKLDNGFQIEFWGGIGDGRGLLGDHNEHSGTDSDIAIAYRNHYDELCLWLIEHKLTEKEFTECGGCKSDKRVKSKHICEKSFGEILENKNLCYYHDVRKSNYWKITAENKEFFVNHALHASCPFKGGMNQLWRNQLLGLALENSKSFVHVYFSVVKHPENKSLDKSINQYKELINNDARFSVFDSSKVVKAANSLNDEMLNTWVKWYCCLYKIEIQ